MDYKLNIWKHPGTLEKRVYIKTDDLKAKVFFYENKKNEKIKFGFDRSSTKGDYPMDFRFLDEVLVDGEVSIELVAKAICEEILDDQSLSWDDNFSEILGCAE